MVFLIPQSLVKIYENWDIRGAILLSFSLQVFLVLFAPLRKRSNSSLVGLCIWSAYLLADWAPNFSVGLIFSDNFSDIKDTNASSSKDNLMAFWAPFLLLHFGGPDTITALALEDSRLWRGQIPTFFLQLGVPVYVFILTLPGNTLWIPTVLIFISGIIKYTERTRALYLASKLPFEKERILSLLYKYFPRIIRLLLELKQSDALRDAEIQGGEIEVAKHSSPTKVSADEALRMIEVQLELLYEMLYTKAPVLHKKIGFLLRFAAFSIIIVTLGVFTLVERNGSDKFNKIDVIVTYTLLYGAVCLDTISLVHLVFSEWTIAMSFSIKSQENSFIGHLLKFYEANTAKLMLSLRRQRWSKCKKEPYTKFQALSTPLLFRKWCGSIPRHNLIRYCLGHRKNQVLKGVLYEVANCFGARELLEMLLYKENSSFLLELWQFIFNELIITKTMHAKAGQQFSYKIIFEYVLQRAELNAESTKKFMNFLIHWLSNGETLAFGYFIVVWHIATDLCYADEHDDHKEDDERHFGKLLSDYMLYLLIMQPNMLAEVTGTNGRDKFEAAFKEATEFFGHHDGCFIPNTKEREEISACRCLLDKYEWNDSLMRTVLSEAWEAAKTLRQLQGKKWKVIGIAWVQMLLFAAYNSKVSSHVKQLPEGGELISLVWLLMLELVWENDQIKFVVE